jgi:hypothetical protein
LVDGLTVTGTGLLAAVGAAAQQAVRRGGRVRRGRRAHQVGRRVGLGLFDVALGVVSTPSLEPQPANIKTLNAEALKAAKRTLRPNIGSPDPMSEFSVERRPRNSVREKSMSLRRNQNG